MKALKMISDLSKIACYLLLILMGLYNSTYAQVPDNISNETCVGTPPSTTWSMKKLYTSSQAIYDADVPLVGDVDGDKKIEIVCANYKGDYTADSVIVFYGINDGAHLGGSVKYKFKTCVFNPSVGSRAIAKIGGVSYIFIAEFTKETTNSTAYLYRYNLTDGSSLKFPTPYFTGGSCEQTIQSVLVTDFNGDGTPEVMVRGMIYNAATGNLLLDARSVLTTYGMGGGHPGDFGTYCGSGGIWSYPAFPVAADMDNDDKPEFVAGNKIYKINIVSTNSTASNSCSVLRSCNSAATGIGDGSTVVADINMDGYLDVIVSRNPGYWEGTTKYVYVWDGKTGDLIGNVIAIDDVAGESKGFGPSIPFIGDLDGDGRPDIAFSTYKKLHAYKWNGTNFVILNSNWPVTTSDGSSATTLTLFDFNQDGFVELVYRDETRLRVLDVNGDEKYSMPCYSATLNEYPVVADVTGDGKANIVALGKLAYAGGNKGYLHVFDSEVPGSWAPARPVWNQWAYNAVNVNADLTIPVKYFNPSKQFTGGTCGTVRPYNGFLMQQTMLNSNGCPLFNLPDIMWNGSPVLSLNSNTGVLTISFKVKNVENAGIGSPVYFSVYKTSVTPANLIGTGAYNGYINSEQNITVSFTINNFMAQMAGASSLIVRLNDNPNAVAPHTQFPYQQECNINNNETPLNLFLANDDYAQTLKSISVTTDVLANDLLASCSDIISLTGLTVTNGNGGTAVWEGTKIKYTPNAGFFGNDTVQYSITCGTQTSTAKIFVTVTNVDFPDNIKDNVGCAGAPTNWAWSIQRSFTSPVATEKDMHAYASPVVGDLNGDGFADIVVPRYSNSTTANGVIVYWGGKPFNSVSRTIITTSNFYSNSIGSIGIVKTKINGVDKAIIVIECTDGRLRAYDPLSVTPNTAVWQSVTTGTTAAYTTDKNTAKHYVPVQFADFNGDGIPEIYTSNRVFNSSTGVLLVQGTATDPRGYIDINLNGGNGAPGYFTSAADIDGDGKPELLAGIVAYKIDITNLGSAAGNTITKLKEISPVSITGSTGTSNVSDGITIPVDINNDGQLDVLVRTWRDAGANQKDLVLLAWSPQNQNLIAKYTMAVPVSVAAASQTNGSVPAIGDVDGDGKLEVIQATANRLYGFRLNTATQTFDKVYEMTTPDAGGASGVTLFDFNSDKIDELVYRDNKDLRIMKADAGTFIDLATINSADAGAITGTMGGHVYPVIADIDGDGYAEIVAVRPTVTTGIQGTLQIYKGATAHPWAATRSVWNQYGYTPTFVNTDLTVPKIPLNVATKFSGACGNVAPFNAYLKQQSIVDMQGCVVNLLPNLVWDGTPAFNHYGNGELMVDFKVKNIGDAGIGAPVHFTIYKDAIKADSIVYTGVYDNIIFPGKTADFSVILENFLEKYPQTSKIIVRLNDSAFIKHPYQQECDYSDSIRVKNITGIFHANDDYIQSVKDIPIGISVLENDALGACKTTGLGVSVTNGAHGAAVWNATDKVIVYTPSAGYVGNDEISYTITCGGETSTAKVHIKVLGSPDNIVGNCTVAPTPNTTWAIERFFTSNTLNEKDIYSIVTPVVGDLNNDGLPDIVIARSNVALSIYWGSKDKAVVPRTNITVASFQYYNFGSLGIVKTEIGGVEKSIIVVECNDGKLRAYDGMGGAIIWTSTASTTEKNNAKHYVPVQFADFNGDGIPEIYTSNRIFNSSTGALLVQGSVTDPRGYVDINFNGTNGASGYFTSAADIDGDGKPELLAGTVVYKVDITNTLNATGNTITQIKQTPPVTITGSTGTKDITDGLTIPVDINNDGQLDVLVRTWLDVGAGQKDMVLLAWNSQDGSLLAKYTMEVPVVAAATSQTNGSIPAVGDIDGDGKPEIVLTTVNRMYGFKFNAAGKTFDKVYEMTTPDAGGASGVTLFDFNSDGIDEIVYRDNKDLRIMKAAAGTFTDLATINSADTGPITATMSGYVYPVVVDIDLDGAAEIIAVRPTSTAGTTGTLQIYKSATGPWASSRYVWNQYGYNSLNINNDLTIPKALLNPATVFSGGACGAVRPFNAYLKQQNMLSSQGCVVKLLPDLKWTATAPSFMYNGMNGQLVVTAEVKNHGEAAMVAPVYFTVYKETVTQSNVIGAISSSESVMPNETVGVTIKVDSLLAKYPSITKVIVRMNDSAFVKYPYQQECIVDGITIEKNINDIFGAQNDYGQTLKNMPIAIRILDNDAFGTCRNGGLLVSITPGSNGTAVWNAIDSTLIFTPNAGFLGGEEITYTIGCAGDLSTAKVYITVVEMPDNIDVNSFCVTTPPAGKWSIQRTYLSSEEKVFEMCVPLIGNIDGDDHIEIVMPGASWEWNVFSPDTIKIFDGTARVLKRKFQVERFHAGFGTYAMADVDGDGQSEIFIATDMLATPGNRGYLLCYSNEGTLKWKSNMPYTDDPVKKSFIYLSIADINNDGVPEVLAGDRIFNARTGDLLLDCNLIANGLDHGTGSGHGSYYSERSRTEYYGALAVLADMDKDGTLELIAGRNIYKLNISSANPALNTCTILRSAKPRYDVGDGYTVVADIDLDGILDVIVTRELSTDMAGLYVWNGATGELMTKVPVSISSSRGSGGIASMAFVGNLNQDVYPEIAFSTYDKLNAYRYNNVTRAVEPFWTNTTTDVSSATTLTLFDFNQDGKMELVYRDQDNMRIINGLTGSNLTTLACQSYTMNEYSVIADISNSGQTSIICGGRPSKTWYSSGNIGNGDGYLYIFDSNPATGDPWAPSRKVWNQWAYNAVNVNENLTIPKVQLPVSSVFAGLDEVIGTSDDVRPYNGFLMQQTILNNNGNPLFYAANLEWGVVRPFFTYYSQGDSLVITVRVENNGQSVIGPPIYFTVYKNSILTANKLITAACNEQLLPGEKKSMSFTLHNFSTISNLQKLIVRMNDNGTKFPAQPECDTNDSERDKDVPDILVTKPDYLKVEACVATPTILDILDNDKFTVCNGRSNITIDIIKPPHHALSLTVDANKNLLYTPQSNYVGLDSLQYTITCPDAGEPSGSAWVYIDVTASAFSNEVWYFGQGLTAAGVYQGSAGIAFNKLGDGTYSVKDTSGVSKVNSLENSLVVTSAYCEGEVLFYMQNDSLYNTQNKLMKNGRIAGHKSDADGLASCYMGDNKYLLFSLSSDYDHLPIALNAYVVDMNSDNGLGGVVKTIAIEAASNNMMESVELIPRAGTSNQYWLVYTMGANMRSRLIDVSDPANPVIGSAVDVARGLSDKTYVLTSNAQRSMLAVTYQTTANRYKVSFYDFNSKTGAVSNHRTYATKQTTNELYGVAFSANGKYAYIANKNLTVADSIWQIDVTGTTPIQVDRVVYNGYKGGGLKLAPNGNIYVALGTSNTGALGVITDANLATPLSGRFNPTGFALAKLATVGAFSTSLTKPALQACNDNIPPMSPDITEKVCAGQTSSVTVNVLAGSSDANGNTIFLTNARFTDPNDYTLADLHVNIADSTVTLTNKVSVPVGHVYNIVYLYKDNGVPVSQCNSSRLAITVEGCIVLQRDTAITTVNKPVTVDVLVNDSFGTCTRDNITISLSTVADGVAKHAASVAIDGNKNVVYTPVTDWIGLDSLRYIVTDCNSADVKDSTFLYVVTLKQGSLNYVACPGASVTLSMQAITGIQYYWYSTQTGGSVVALGSNVSSLTVTKDVSAIQTWWVEARYGTLTFPRYRIDLNLSESCGGTPVSCAVDGTLLFKEDFEGNDPSDPAIKPVGIPQVIGYTYDNTTGAGFGLYSIRKQSYRNGGQWYVMDDHTYPGDPKRGYLFQVDASDKPGQFYEYQLNGICSGLELYFSVWLADLVVDAVTYTDRTNLIFLLEDDNGNTIAQYNTGNIPETDPKWKQYGFKFKVPDNLTSLKLKIINNGKGSGGNDFVMDDIQVHLCTAPVAATVNAKLTDTICRGNTVTLGASYTDNGTFVTAPTDQLSGYWMQSSTGNINKPADWSKVAGSDVTGMAGSVTITIPAFTATPQAGITNYYRFVISNTANIDSPNCRAASAVLPVVFYNYPLNYPDIRVQTCVEPNRAINLSGYLDTLDFISVNWTTVAAPSVTPAGIIQTNTLTAPNTYIYKYAITNHCVDTTARLYLKALDSNVVGLPPKEVVICYESAANLQLNQILGIEASGTWTFDAVVAPYVKTAVAPAVCAGAKIFDGKGLYEALRAANSSQFKVTYKGDTEAREIEIRYKVTELGSCLYNEEYVIKIILTSTML